MNKKLKLILPAYFSLLVSLSTAAANTAPEINLADVNGSMQEFESTVPEMGSAFYTLSPEKRGDNLRVGALPETSEILSLAKDIEQGKYGKYESLLISYRGELMFESYYKRGRVNLPHYQASAAKGYMSLAIGRAIQMGYLTMDDLHKPVLDFLKEVDRTDLAPGVEKITLHHTLSMQSGLKLDREKLDELAKDPTLIKGQKLAQTYFKLTSPITDKGQAYNYQRTDPRLTMMVLDAVVPISAKDFIKTELLDKLGITNYYWKDDINGLPVANSGVSMTSRDMIKWGTLIEQQGVWKRDRLISRAFMGKATDSVATPYSETFDFSDFRYGYYFWGTKIKVGEQQYDAKMAWGGGSQFVMALEELDLVIAITARIRMNGDKTFEVLSEHILPTFVAKEHDRFSYPKLVGPYMGQTPPGKKAMPFAPGIISKDGWEIEGVFSPDMKEFYYTTRGGKYARPTVFGFRQQNNVWKKYIEFTRDGELGFSPDGSRLYMAEGYKDRVGDGWSERKNLGPLIDQVTWGIMRLSASSNETFVFDDYKGGGVIRISAIENGKRRQPKPMVETVNSGQWTAHPFIAPDESYLIFDSEREDGFGESDLYITFKQEDGSWGDAINMGKNVNSDKWDAFATVTSDGKYMLFNRGIDRETNNNDIYWVDASIIKELRSMQ